VQFKFINKSLNFSSNLNVCFDEVLEPDDEERVIENLH